MFIALLEIKNLKTYYNTKEGIVKATDDVSFNLEEGQILGLVGESGCGKTTTSLSIMQLLPNAGSIEGGKIIFDGEDLVEMSTKKLLKIRGNEISMVFQGAMNALNPVHKIGDQIKEVISIHEPKVEEEESWDRVVAILEKVGIPESRAKDYPHQLSGGMKQRALIAMALVCNPRIIVTDEPVTALDVIVQAQVLSALKKMQKDFNLSMIIVTHDLSVVAKICDTIAVMYAGKICEVGTVKEVFTNPKHPYTEALLGSFPSITGPKKDLIEIKGYPPNLIYPPSGCRFHPRCHKRVEACDKRIPLNTPTSDGYVACLLYEDGEK
ncbi:MAG: ABC transporter ATP-binding protein [Candidatus Heimdallarchaeota archaeon]|nr:ABC transporter ATP-binding protein [Candidatus Heimdallarchaeota archaeon]